MSISPDVAERAGDVRMAPHRAGLPAVKPGVSKIVEVDIASTIELARNKQAA